VALAAVKGEKTLATLTPVDVHFNAIGRCEDDHGGKTPACLAVSWCDPAPLLEIA
jgi:hypothetical protein